MLTFRKATFGAADVSARSVPIVLCTDMPVQRSNYVEQLDIANADLSRGDLPLIESHNSNTVNIGVVRGIVIDGNKLRGVAVFGHSARADELLADIQSGVVSGVSIGYQLQDQGVPVRTRDGREALRFKFLPFEVSVVAVPADTDAGFYRSQFSNFSKDKIMDTKLETKAADYRVSEILALGDAFKRFGADKLAIQALRDGKSLEAFREQVKECISTKPLPLDYISTAAKPVDIKRIRTLDDFRAYYGQPATSEVGLTLVDFLRGVAGMRTSETATRALSVGTDSSGGYLAPTMLMPQVLSALTAASALTEAGATIMPLPGNAKSYSLAGVDTLPTAAWRAENGLVAESEPTFREILLTPKSLSLVVKVSRELLADGINVDQVLYEALGKAIAKEIDRAGLYGAGAGAEPQGLANISGINAVSSGTNGAVIANYSNLFAATQAILQADGAMPTGAVMSPRSMVKFGGLIDTTGQPMNLPAMLEKVKFTTTSQISNALTVGSSTDCSQIFVGDFKEFIFGIREQLSIQVLNEAFADYGQIGFMVHARLDVAVTNAARFAIISGVRG